MSAARLLGHHRSDDESSDTFWSLSVPVKESPLPWQEKGFSYTASGYGARIPTRYMVLFNGRWRRVYCRTYSNAGTCFIGQLREFGERIIVDHLP